MWAAFLHDTCYTFDVIRHFLDSIVHARSKCTIKCIFPLSLKYTRKSTALCCLITLCMCKRCAFIGTHSKLIQFAILIALGLRLPQKEEYNSYRNSIPILFGNE